jgi:hypothetical protein
MYKDSSNHPRLTRGHLTHPQVPYVTQRVGFAELVRNLVPLPTSTKRGRGVVLEASGID